MDAVRKILTVLGAGIAIASPSEAQRFGRGPSSNGKATADVRSAFRPLIANARRCTVRVFSRGRQVSLGTIVDAGLVVTKASELGSDLTCRPKGGESTAAKLIATDVVNDIALLQVAGLTAPEVEWADGEPPGPASFVAAVGPTDLPIAVGVVSNEVHERTVPDRAYLGVRLSQDTSRALVDEVMAGHGAARAGLKAKDVIVQVGGESIENLNSLRRALGERAPGERVTVRVRRGEQEVELTATLGRNTGGQLTGQERYWGPLSNVRDGFEQVLQHDVIVRPNQCGSPLVDLDGKVVGINIARAGRVETLALPTKLARSIVAKLRKAKKPKTKRIGV